MKLGIIGGSGIYDIEGLGATEEISVETPYGKPSAHYRAGKIEDRKVVFLPRHGADHSIAPHKINYRANIWGFKSLGVEKIISVGAVGGISGNLKPGDLVVLDQLIDFTFGARQSTFFEDDKVAHIDFTEPYCAEMRKTVLSVAENIGLAVKENGSYICVNGPRLETAKEIRHFSMIGADVVGMTGMPEAALAREAEICLCGMAVVTNYAAGISKNKLTVTEVIETMKKSTDNLKKLIREFVLQLPAERNCDCKDALKNAVM
ncbi:MAG: S-methyl-5'-thioadenosine phosphorylase [Nitrospirae bacterium]|nr:MAG: S-methyl-5'-thioadenosine phosphorylase [Nitrospirota bacterium]